MKKIILILAVTIGSAFVWQSCTKDGDLIGGGDTRESYIGVWSVSDQCSKQTYAVDIKEDEQNTTQVIIVNFANYGKPVTAVVADNTIYVGKQDIGNDTFVSGNGKLNGAMISWSSYNIETEGDLEECTATFQKN